MIVINIPFKDAGSSSPEEIDLDLKLKIRFSGDKGGGLRESPVTRKIPEKRTDRVSVDPQPQAIQLPDSYPPPLVGTSEVVEAIRRLARSNPSIIEECIRGMLIVAPELSWSTLEILTKSLRAASGRAGSDRLVREVENICSKFPQTRNILFGLIMTADPSSEDDGIAFEALCSEPGWEWLDEQGQGSKEVRVPLSVV